jgi:hypothetical protein
VLASLKGVQASAELRGLGRQGLSVSELVYLEPGDNAAAVRERLRGAKAKRVLLVVPKGCPGLDSPVDLRLLAREAAADNREVALVTRDARLKELAREQGFRTFSSAATGQSAVWKSPRTERPRLAPPNRRRVSSLERTVGGTEPQALRTGEKILFSIIFVLMLAFLALIMILIVPAATVTLRPVTYPVQTELTIEADPDVEDVDFVNLRVPARVVEVEIVGDDRLATTAIRDEPNLNATGEVVFTNKRSEPTTVISGTVVTTSAGTTIRFRTAADVTLPPTVGGRARAPVIAIEPGPSGNVAAYSINRVEGPLDRQVNVINASPTAGGAMAQVTYVTNTDKEQLSESLLSRLKEEGHESLLAGLSESEFMPQESVLAVVLSETYDKFPGEVADSLGLHMRVLVRGTAMSKEDPEALGARMLQFEVPEGFRLLPEETSFEITQVSEAGYDGTLTFEMNVDGTTWVEIDEVEIKEAIKGKSIAEAEEYLANRLSLAEQPSVEISTPWWQRVPWLPFRISIHVLSAEGELD